jgi:hypothetical protein
MLLSILLLRCQLAHAQHLQVLGWPPRSQDLNTMEHLWHYLEEVMRKLAVVRNKEELWSTVEVSLEICGVTT